MWADFQALCDLGGRLAGSDGEAAALAFAQSWLAAVPGAKVREHPVAYPGWRGRTAQLTSAMTGMSFPWMPLLGTAPASGLVAEGLDPRLGRPAAFLPHPKRLPDRVAPDPT